VRRVCVFAGSSPGARPEFVEAAAELGEALAVRGLSLVYGGSGVGLMAALADAALAAGGRVTGVITRALADSRVAHPGLTELLVVESMHERKATMVGMADAFVALPGGLGTLEELLEVLTWSQLGLNAKPAGALNVAGYFEPLARLLDHAVTERFLRPAHRDILQIADDVDALLEALASYRPVRQPKWLPGGHST